ncbi:MAG: phosphoglycerate dehydrogenase [Thermoleophilia bacterium]
MTITHDGTKSDVIESDAMKSAVTKRILIKEKLAPEGVAYLEEQGFVVDLGFDWTADELIARIAPYHGLIIRSATKVTAAVIAAATNLQVIGRAGVGVDNIDIAAATKRGIIVVNAPASNVLSAAEHTIAMIMACARGIPQAHARLKQGEWVKKNGVELMGKTLGILGLGRIGFLVAERARGLKMNVVAYDPFVPAEKFHELGLERADTPARIYREADFITVHLPKNSETLGFIDDEAFAQMKDGVRIVNVARGGIVDEQALARAVESGKVAAAAVDVYPQEPTTDSVLFQYEQIICTPHLGASTVEAQMRAGTQVAEQVALALKGQFAPNAVNVPLVAGEDTDELMPYLGVCEQLGKLLAQIATEPVETIEITYAGVIGRYDTRILTFGILQGLLANTVEGEVNFVNVAGIAEERGMTAKETKQPAAVDFLNLVSVTARDAAGEPLTVAGTAIGPRHRPRFVTVYGADVDIEPVENMVFVRTAAQVPGTFGVIGRKVGEFGINISQVSVGRARPGQLEVMGLALDAPISDEQLREVVVAAGLHDAKRVRL